MTAHTMAEREPNDPLYSDESYELLERLFGEEKAACIGRWTV